MWSRVPVASVLAWARVGGRRPRGMRRVRRVRGVVRVGMRRVGRPHARWTHTAAVATRARPLPVPVSFALSVTVPVSLTIPVSFPVAIPIALPLPLRPAPLSVHQIVSLQASFPISAILVLVFMSADME